MSSLPEIETQTAREMTGQLSVANERPLSSGQTAARLPQGFDKYSLTPDERKQYGLKENEAHCWVRNPKYWEQHEMSDRASEWAREAEGRRIVTKKDGAFITNGDLILGAKHKAEAEDEERRQKAATDKYLSDLERGDVENVPRWNPQSNEALRELAQDQHYANEAAGLIGPTGSMDYASVVAQFGKERVQREEAFYRNGGRHVSPQNKGQEDRIATAEEAIAGKARGRASVGYSGKAYDEGYSRAFGKKG